MKGFKIKSIKDIQDSATKAAGKISSFSSIPSPGPSPAPVTSSVPLPPPQPYPYAEGSPISTFTNPAPNENASTAQIMPANSYGSLGETTASSSEKAAPFARPELATNTSSSRSLPGQVKKDSKTPYKIKMPKDLRSMAGLDQLEIDLSGADISIVSDDKKKSRKEGLCTACSSIDFEQFDARHTSTRSPENLTRKLIFLDRILRKKKNKSCNFCVLLFDAIAENDPFNHPAVRNYLPSELVGKTFREWAGSLGLKDKISFVPGYKPPYPFGRSRDKVELQQGSQGEDVVVAPTLNGNTDPEQMTADEKIQLGGAAAAVGVTSAMWDETDTERVKIMATVGTLIPTVTSLMTNLDAKLPVAVSIIVHNVNHQDKGLLNVDVWGYGNGPRAPLSRISTFNLRVASSYQSIDHSLNYGKLLQPQINVEGDCKTWFEHCSEHHGQKCDEPSWWNELQPPSGPHFRLIDVNARRVVQMDVAILEQHKRPKYAALSYVWGVVGTQRLNLLMRNLDALTTGLESQPASIAKTILDAMEVTRRMGLQYIWVDSLCIVQHDDYGENDPDARVSQIEQMDRIYGHAALTIVAADGLDAEAGLTGILPTSVRHQIASQVQPNVNVLLAVQYKTSNSKWDTRAWTLQEKLLSKRMLIFNDGYVSFHCRHGVLREDMPASHAGNGPPQIPWVSLPKEKSSSLIKRAWDGTPVLLRSPFFTEYANLLAQYTSRDMSDSRDALNAVLGLLKVLEKMTSPKQICYPIGSKGEAEVPMGYTLHGLPEKFLDIALLWQPPAAKGVYLNKRSHENLPSWSWAGWEVSKFHDVQPDAATMHQPKPGVRFEEPFWVGTNDDLSLKKVVGGVSEDKRPTEERLKPLVMWYKCLKVPTAKPEPQNATLDAPSAPLPATIAPVNDHGMGLAFHSVDAAELHKFRENAIQLRTTYADPGIPSIPVGVPIDHRHLVCETYIASFHLGPLKSRLETHWKQSSKGLIVDKELTIIEAAVFDDSKKVIGKVIPTDQRKSFSMSERYDFILLSESQYWGDEERVDISGLPLFNVMFVEWDTRREFASRVGVGKIEKGAFWAASPRQEVVILK